MTLQKCSTSPHGRAAGETVLPNVFVSYSEVSKVFVISLMFSETISTNADFLSWRYTEGSVFPVMIRRRFSAGEVVVGRTPLEGDNSI